MGGGFWNASLYSTNTSSRLAMNMPDFDYDSKVKSGVLPKMAHADLDPLKMKNNMRESRDSDEHPESLPIAVFFDVTGSMGSIPIGLQKKLCELMDVVTVRAGIVHPNILMGAVGDATVDRVPFQVTQFESDNRIDDQLRSIYVEGGGGGQTMESYGLAFRFAAYHTATDAFEKRGKRGYFFTIGDEMPWPKVPAEQIMRVFGVQGEDETVETLIAKASEKWEIFHLHMQEGSYQSASVNGKEIVARWRGLLGERLVLVEDKSLVCEVIAGLIHGLESARDVDTIVRDIGLSGAAAASVRNAIVPAMSHALAAKGATGTLPDGHDGDSAVSTI